jgi:hypothetical protein
MRIGIAIKKAAAFRGVNQEFHNTYFYELPTAVTAPAESLIDELVTFEKTIHSGSVPFLHGACWSAGGSAGENAMIFQKALTGFGSGTFINADPERAVLIRWPAGFDSRGRPVYLRKWYHTLGNFASATPYGTDQLANQQPISTAHRASMATAVNAIKAIGNLEAWQLCAPSGRQPTGDAQTHPWLEHHQLGDQWR